MCASAIYLSLVQAVEPSFKATPGQRYLSPSRLCSLRPLRRQKFSVGYLKHMIWLSLACAALRSTARRSSLSSPCPAAVPCTLNNNSPRVFYSVCSVIAGEISTSAASSRKILQRLRHNKTFWLSPGSVTDCPQLSAGMTDLDSLNSYVRFRHTARAKQY